MAIDAEDILVRLWRFLRFFIYTSYMCAQKHPFVSCMLLLFFFIYVFFNLLVYHSPFLIFIAILLRLFWTSDSEQPAIQDAKSEEIKERPENQRKPLKIPRPSADHDVVAVTKSSESPSLRRQKSRRTRVKPKEKSINIEWKTSIPQILEENELLLPLSVAKRSWSFQHGETSTTRDNIAGFEISKQLAHEHRLPCAGGETESRKFEGNDVGLETDTTEDVEDEEEEEAHEGVNNKAVEWTEDDQKNLVDLGLSEIERNRRLESLIAKRRARKLGKNQLEKGLIDVESSVPPSRSTSQIPAPIFVARSNPFETPNVSNEIEGLQVPGSAPSILLPTQNPFDLPYDPLEEKPNLLADSFTQEFTAVNQKEMFCRHESFTLGPFQFDTKQDRRDAKFGAFFPTENRAPEGLEYSRFRRQSGDHDRLIEQLLGGVGKSHMDHTPPIVQSEPQCSLQVSNSEASNVEGDAQTKNDMISDEEILNGMEGANQMDSISTITEVDTEPSVVEDSETASSSSSEVANRSEVPTHGYHVEDDNMFSCSNPTVIEPLFDSSPTANDKRLRMEDDGRLLFGDKHTVHTPSYSIASDLQVEVSEVGSPPLTVGNMTPTDGESLSSDEENMDGASYDDTSQVMDEVDTKLSGFSSLEALAAENPETTMQLSEKLAAHPFFEVLSESTDKSSIPPDESIERNAVNDVRDSVSDTIDDIEAQEKHEDGDGDGEEQILTRQESVVYLPEPDEDLELEFNETTSQNLAKYLSADSEKPTKGNADLNLEGDREAQTEQESVADVPKSIEAEDHSSTTEKRKDEPSVLESEVSCINQSDDEALAPAEQQDSMVEVVVIVDSSLPSSQTAATIEQIAVDEVPSSNLDEMVQIKDAPKFDTEDVMQSSAQGEELPNDTSLIVPQNVILQEPSALEKINDIEANIIFNISQPEIQGKSSIGKTETNNDTEGEKEEKTLFNPEVAEELPETPSETGSGSNKNIQNASENIAEKSSSPPNESIDRNAVYDVKDSVCDTIDDMEDQEKHEDGEGEEQMLTRQEVVDNKAEPAEETEVESNARSRVDSENLTQPINSNAESNPAGDHETPTEQESVPDAPKSMEAEDNWSTIEERTDEQSLVESEVPCINLKYEEAIASAEQQELIVEEEVLVNSSSSSSPTAATIKLTPEDEASSSNLDQRMQSIDAPIFDTEDVMQSSSQEEKSPRDGTIMIKPQNEEYSVEDSSNHIPNTSHSETLQDPFASENFTDEAKILSNISEPVTKDNNEETETNLCPEVAEDLSETPTETGSGSNDEDIENFLGKLAEEQTNLPSKDSSVTEKEDK